MKFFYILSFLLIAVTIFIVHRNGVSKLFSPDYEKAQVYVGLNAFEVDVADDMTKRDKGLAGREELEPNEGMLFVFNNSASRTFWMKGMLIPIDIVWINKGEVVGIAENVDPQIGEPLYKLSRHSSPEPADMVLEVQAGRAQDLKIQVGDVVNVKL